MKNYNILIISDIIPSDYEGGSGSVSWELAKNLLLKRHKVTIITKGNKEHKSYENYEDIDIYRYGNNLLKCKKLFTKLSYEFKFDLTIGIHPYSSLGILPLIGKTKIPFIYIFNSPWPEEFKIRDKDFRRNFLQSKIGFFIRKFVEMKVLLQSKKVVVLSEFMKNKVKSMYNILDEKIEIIPGGIDLKKFYPVEDRKKIREILGLPKEKVILLTIRNLVSRMGLENLISAFSMLKKDFKEIFLVIGGRGYLETKLKKMAIEYNLRDEILFTGYIPEEKLALYYQMADLFVLPTKELEGFGLIILESYSCGTPVVATPIGAIPETIIKFDKDFLFKGVRDIDIYEGLKNFILNYLNDETLRIKCRQFVEKNYSWSKFTDQIEKIIFKII